MRSNIVDVTGIVKHETAKAYLVDHGGKEPIWLAKSQIEVEQNKDGRTVTISMEQWLAEEKGLI